MFWVLSRTFSVLNGDGPEQDLAEFSSVEAILPAGEYFKATQTELGYDVPTNGVKPHQFLVQTVLAFVLFMDLAFFGVTFVFAKVFRIDIDGK